MDYQLAKNKIAESVLDSVRWCVDEDFPYENHEQVLFAVVHFIGTSMRILGICSSLDDAVAVAHRKVSTNLVSKAYVVNIKNTVNLYAKIEIEKEM